jgi:hypothetical protein
MKLKSKRISDEYIKMEVTPNDPNYCSFTAMVETVKSSMIL